MKGLLMKGLDNNDSGQYDVLSAFILLMVTIVAVVFLLMIGGSFLDGFIYKYSQIVTLHGMWLTMYEVPMKVFRYFYSAPIFLIGIMVVWVFKMVIENMEYSKQQDQQYQDYKYWR